MKKYDKIIIVLKIVEGKTFSVNLPSGLQRTCIAT